MKRDEKLPRGTHDVLDDPRNENVLVYIGGELVPRGEAKVSVFDSGFMMGDGVWEGLRLHNGRFAFLDLHLDRLLEGARALDLDIGMSRDELMGALYETVRANDMHGDVHARLMVTRGPKKTPFQDPRLSLWGPTIVIIAEHKKADPGTFERGIRLFTAHVHRGAPDVQDPKINSHSKLNCILAMIQAIKAGADEALMLDPHGFVSTCNSTNFFIVRRGELWTSTGKYCLNGITRRKVMEVCRHDGIDVLEKDFSLVDVYGADEAFVTGTFGGQIPVVEVDGRTIADGGPGPVTRRARELYQALIERECPPA
ncbi:MAG: D-amino acid aminotransferase [Alphaproteobacteria bacterium]